MYIPDNWIVIKINTTPAVYKILAGWSGGYLTGDSWRMNSGIEYVEEHDDYFEFYGSSGSCYKCHKNGYGLRLNNAHVWNALKTKKPLVEKVSENTDWVRKDWTK